MLCITCKCVKYLSDKSTATLISELNAEKYLERDGVQVVENNHSWNVRKLKVAADIAFLPRYVT